MGEFFKWIGSLETELQWILFISVALLMALFPYIGFIGRYVYLWLSNTKPQIVDFSWRLVPDLKIGQIADSNYYLTKSEKPLLFDGMVLMLNWHVTGAYRIDIFPLGQNIKGNCAYLSLRPGNNIFTLTAHTIKGKLIGELSIDSDELRKLATFNISREKHFGQPNSELLTQKLSEFKILNRKFSDSVDTKPLAVVDTKRMFYINIFANHKYSEVHLGRFRKLSKIYTFKPQDYQQAINEKPLEQQLK
jgi:hypothetical protein